MASVTFAGITKSFGNFDVIPPLDLKIEDEEFIVFVGPSGCGKSTLLRLISGLEQVSDGEIYIGDELVNSIAPSKRDIAMVFQDYALYPHMTVRNNMTFALERQRMPKDEIARRVERVARQLQITQYLDRRPKALSGGQRQRVAMGRAMVREPRVFLFDEPLSNLDAKLRVDVRGEIKALAKELRTTMVFVTHDQVEAMTLADRIVILEAGRIQQVGTPQEVYSQPANLFVAGFIGSPPMNFFDCTRKGSDLILRNERVIKPVGNLARVLSSASGDEFVLGVRPEHLIPTEISAADIVAQIGVVEPLGPDTLCTFDLAGKRAMVRVDPDLQPQPDDALPLRINLDKAHLFDPADSGVCLTSKLAAA